MKKSVLPVRLHLQLCKAAIKRVEPDTVLGTYLNHASSFSWHVHLVAPHIHKNFCCDWNWQPLPWLIFSLHQELVETISCITQCCQNIATGSLEVIGLAIKGEVVRVSRSRAGAASVGMAAKLTIHYTARLLGATGAGDTVDYPSVTITGAKALTFFAVPELFTILHIASLVIASARCWWNTLVAI